MFILARFQKMAGLFYALPLKMIRPEN